VRIAVSAVASVETGEASVETGEASVETGEASVETGEASVAIAHRATAHRVIDPRVIDPRVIDPHVHRAQTARRVIDPRVHPGRRASDPHVRHAQRGPLRVQRRRLLQEVARLLQHRPRRLRASRGERKPCYWHRHDINIANSIAGV
jgi:hypothetical protein